MPTNEYAETRKETIPTAIYNIPIIEHLFLRSENNPGKMNIIITPIVIPLKSFNVLSSFMKIPSAMAKMKKIIVAVMRNDFVISLLE